MTVFGVPVGRVFTDALVNGIMQRYDTAPRRARVTLVVNSERAKRVISNRFAQETQLLPRIVTMDGLIREEMPWRKPIHPPDEIEQILAIVALLRGLVDTGDVVIEHAHLFELAYQLLALLHQCAERQIPPEALVDLDVTEHSEHWQLNAKFFQILVRYWYASGGDEIWRRASVGIDALAEFWTNFPNLDPIYVVGSTGSRLVMRDLMRVVCELPNGHIVLPNAEFDPFENMREDHPHFGQVELLSHLGVDRLELWGEADKPISKILRTSFAPAPYTDLWLEELPNIRAYWEADAMDLEMLNAKTTQDEVRALTARIHAAVSNDQSVCVITPDRNLVRQLSRRLHALGIVTDDSAGQPMRFTGLGRLAGQVLDCMETPDRNARLLGLMRHPLVEKTARSQHMTAVNWFDEFVIRRDGPASVWERASQNQNAEKYKPWIEKWSALFDDPLLPALSLPQWMQWHIDCIERCTGQVLDQLAAPHLGESTLVAKMQNLANLDLPQAALSFDDYLRFWRSWISRQNANEAMIVNASVKFLGTIEARTENADLVIMAGLNEGIWPSGEIADMWLSRDMRVQLGLEVPERFIGLAASDFLSGFGSKSLVLSRHQIRDGSPTVESRFLTRFRILLDGAVPHAWDQVQARGEHWIECGRALDIVPAVPPAPRPAPIVKPAERPRRLSVTGIENWVANPYKFYAQKVLGLRELRQPEDSITLAIEGTLMHAILEKFTNDHAPPQSVDIHQLHAAMQTIIPAYGLRELDRLNIEKNIDDMADQFIIDEEARREFAQKILTEHEISASFETPAGFVEVFAKIDRIDLSSNGEWRLFDYKRGGDYKNKTFSPDKKQQLPLSAMILSQEFTGDCDRIEVLRYVPNPSGALGCEISDDYDPDRFRDAFFAFVQYVMADETGFTASFNKPHQGFDFDRQYRHLARFGEWSIGDTPDTRRVSNE